MQTTHRLLLIEDEPGIVQTLTDLFEAKGFQVDACTNGHQGLEAALAADCDLIILDVMLPGPDGFEICRSVRQKNVDVPILMLTARDEISSKVGGLQSGADDYLTKPFHPEELQARVDALLRRAEHSKTHVPEFFEVAGVRFDFRNSQVMRDGKTIELSERECRLLRYLIQRRGKTVTREELLRQIWGYQSLPFTRTVDVHIAWLRQKIEANPRTPRLLLTVHGLGYRFAD